MVRPRTRARLFFLRIFLRRHVSERFLFLFFSSHIKTPRRSLGVTTYVLLTGFSPFGGETDQETFQNISLGEVDFPEELFEDVSAQAKDFVAKLLVLDPRYCMAIILFPNYNYI